MSFAKNTVMLAALAVTIASSGAFAQSEMKSDGMQTGATKSGGMKSKSTEGTKGDMKSGGMGRSDSMPADGKMGGPARNEPMSGGTSR